jgi:hypothetical protein
MFLVLNRKGMVGGDDIVRLIGYLAILTLASFVIWRLILSVMG